MKQVNWQEVLIRCSCIGKIMTEGKGTVLTDKQAEYLDKLLSKGEDALTDKQKKDMADLIAKRDSPPALSDTCTSYLREVYQYYRYGKESIGGAQRSLYVQKGNAMEHESIMLISRFFGFPFEKNKERKNGTHLTGECDIAWEDKKTIIDAKSAWDMESLLSHLPNPDKPSNSYLYDPGYEWQGQGYMSLWGYDTFILSYVLVNMPPEMINWEKEKIHRSLNPATDEDPEYVRQVEKLEHSCTFDEIPIQERIIPFTFERDEEKIRKINARVEDCRIWLEKFEKLHVNLHI